ncbi:hypothetical protein C4Y99_008025, partial [Klebsiella pneumoniae subsp. pneumoniae]
QLFFFNEPLHILIIPRRIVAFCSLVSVIHRLHIMSLLWLLVSDCEQRGCLHLLHIMSLLWLQVCVCEHGVLLAAHRGADEAGGI